MLTIDAIMRDCVQAVINIRNLATSGIASPEASYKHVREHVDKMMGKALAAGMPREEVQAMTFAWVSLADHLASKTRGPLCEYWRHQPLQAHYFPGTVRSQAFFEHIERARRQKQLAVLRSYALAIALGYRGSLSLLDAEKLLRELVLMVEPQTLQHRSLMGTAMGRHWRLQDAHLSWVPAGALLASFALYLILSSVMGHDATIFMTWIDTLTKLN